MEEKQIQKQEKIKQKISELYTQITEENAIKGSKDDVSSITYFDDLVLLQPTDKNMGIAEQKVYVVKIFDENNKESYKIYNDSTLIATVTENGRIIFSEEYKDQISKIDQRFALAIEKADPDMKFKLPEEFSKEDLELTKGEMEETRQKSLEGEEENKEKIEDKEEPLNNQSSEEETLEKIAKKSGIKESDIKSCSSIKPQERVTDAESFEDIAGVKGKYTKVFVVSSSRDTKGNSRFAFWGITTDGNVEQIEGLEERQGVNTGKEIYSINRDGSAVKEQQTAALFTMPNGKEGFSVSIGQYGIVETTYIRKSPGENKFIGSSIKSTTQRPTTREVKEFMNDTRTTDYELKDTINKAEEQIKEHGSNETELKNIDNNKNNDKAIDIDEEVTLHNKEITTLRKQAELYGMTVEEYTQEFEKADGDCSADKIEEIATEQEEKQSEQKEEETKREDRGERPTPEEEALERLLNH